MGWVRAAQLGTASTPGEHKVSREQGVGCRRDGPPPRPSASPLRLAPPPRPSASLRATLTLPPPPTQLSYEGEDAAEPTWDHPHVRQGGWRFERVREGRRLAADIRTVASRRQSAADGARPRLLKRPWEGPERGLRTAWRGGEPPTRMACWSLGGGGGGVTVGGCRRNRPGPAPPQASLKPNSSTSSGSCSRPLRAAQALSKCDV